ncbi:hypothetical protein B6259_02280 [Ruminococcaceae bacterium CPB6]|nr:hypothetical protein B6259_02280 [Ruminococcaceae bacterium CPB6]
MVWSQRAEWTFEGKPNGLGPSRGDGTFPRYKESAHTYCVRQSGRGREAAPIRVVPQEFVIYQLLSLFLQQGQELFYLSVRTFSAVIFTKERIGRHL